MTAAEEKNLRRALLLARNTISNALHCGQPSFSGPLCKTCRGALESMKLLLDTRLRPKVKK